MIFNDLSKIEFILIVAAWGALWAVIDGGRLIRTSNWFERLMCAAPFIAYGVLHFDAGDRLTWFAPLTLATWFTMGMDPGTYFSARESGKMESSPGLIDPIVSFFYGPDPRLADYTARPSIARVRLGMALTGVIQTAGCVIFALIIGQYVAAGIFLIAGILRAAAYAFVDTEIAEPLNGFQRSFLAAIALIM